MTETYVQLARHWDALPMIQEGLSVAGAINADHGQLIGLYLSASKCHMASGKLMAALDYQKEAFKLSLEINNPWLISRHYVHLGLVYSKLNKHSEAVRLMRQSGEMGERLRDGKMGREITAVSHLHLGEIYRETGDLGCIHILLRRYL
jgi:tetratricopeptide (TPR) repeat protein